MSAGTAVRLLMVCSTETQLLDLHIHFAQALRTHRRGRQARSCNAPKGKVQPVRACMRDSDNLRNSLRLTVQNGAGFSFASSCRLNAHAWSLHNALHCAGSGALQIRYSMLRWEDSRLYTCAPLKLSTARHTAWRAASHHARRSQAVCLKAGSSSGVEASCIQCVGCAGDGCTCGPSAG